MGSGGLEIGIIWMGSEQERGRRLNHFESRFGGESLWVEKAGAKWLAGFHLLVRVCLMVMGEWLFDRYCNRSC